MEFETYNATIRAASRLIRKNAAAYAIEHDKDDLWKEEVEAYWRSVMGRTRPPISTLDDAIKRVIRRWVADARAQVGLVDLVEKVPRRRRRGR